MSASLVIESFEAPSRLVHEVFASDENSLSLGCRSSGACREDWLAFASSCFPDAMAPGDLANSSAGGASVVAAAFSQLGVPYVWGGTSPGVGLDCSGLTQYCYRQAGIAIPRNSEDQAAFGRKVPVSDATPGDILWRPGHVAIYIGDDRYIHEPHSGAVCKISSGASHFASAIKIR